MIETAKFGWFLVAVLDLKHGDLPVNKHQGIRQIHGQSNNWFCLISGLRYIN